ncbi:MAG: DNA replication and repair protein RecF [Bacteroidia bacterium]
MYLSSLQLLNFKNYADAQIDFSRGVNCLTGNNGSGKTNILDAVHYLSMCRSYFTATDYQNIKHDEGFFMVKGEFELNAMNESVLCSLKRDQKKQFKRNQKEYDRLNEHIGLLPVVMVAPVDQEIITEGSEVRRKFLDRIISQIDKIYLDDLISYNKILSHRNALLKNFAASGIYDSASLQVWDEQLVVVGEKIFKKRKKFIEDFLLLFLKFYQFIAGEAEVAAINYESQLEATDFSTVLKNALQKDRALQYSTAGIHKDDLNFTISGVSAKKFGSQGQQKSFVIALKLAHFATIKKHKNIKPVMMFDDLFDKLDDDRVSKILNMVHDDMFGQVFITDTHSGRLKGILNEFEIPFYSYHVEKGNVLMETT